MSDNTEKLVYEPISDFGRRAIKKAIKEDNISILITASISAAWFQEDKWAQEICLKLSEHENFNVRGNAILSLGYIAMYGGKLDKARVKQAVRRGLADPEPYVRGHASDVKEDIKHYLKWRF